MGLHTVTWLLSGELVHRDSLGSEQPVRPGQLNLMTAGNGVSHAEAAVPGAAPLHGVQLWVAQPDETRHGPPAFTHHDRLPEVALGSVRATVLLGSLAGVASPARHDTELVGADLAQEPGRAAVPLTPGFEYAFLVTEGRPLVEGHRLEPGQMAYVGRGRVQLDLEADAPARGLLLGGVPFPETPAMWWNFVGRSRPEMVAAARAWNEEDGRFGSVASRLARIPAPDPPGPAPG
jgi:redox-sensitive bicupin YhaK (pirin superfamily)